MKLALLVLAFAFSMQAHAADNDTIVVHKPNKVTVVAGDSVQKILIEGREGDEKYVYRNTVMLGDDAVRKTSFDKDTWDITPSVKIGKNKKDEGDEAGMHIAFGQVSPVSADDRLDFSRNSFEIWWIPLCYEHAFDKQKRHILEFGLGLDWRNYRIRCATQVLARQGVRSDGRCTLSLLVLQEVRYGLGSGAQLQHLLEY